MQAYAQSLWRRAKTLSAYRLGPIELLISLRRAVNVSSNHRRRKFHSLVRDVHRSQQTSTPHISAGDVRSVTAGTVLVVGAGPGFGYAVATRMAEAGFRVGLVSRSVEGHDAFITKQLASGRLLHAYGCDVTIEASVKEMFVHATEDLGVPDLIVYAVQEAARVELLRAESS